MVSNAIFLFVFMVLLLVVCCQLFVLSASDNTFFISQSQILNTNNSLLFSAVSLSFPFLWEVPRKRWSYCWSSSLRLRPMNSFISTLRERLARARRKCFILRVKHFGYAQVYNVIGRQFVFFLSICNLFIRN